MGDRRIRPPERGSEGILRKAPTLQSSNQTGQSREERMDNASDINQDNEHRVCQSHKGTHTTGTSGPYLETVSKIPEATDFHLMKVPEAGQNGL